MRVCMCDTHMYIHIIMYRFQAACLFVNDTADARVLEELHKHGTKLLLLRSAGFNHVDVQKAGEVRMYLCMYVRMNVYACESIGLDSITWMCRKQARYACMRVCRYAV